MLTDFGLQPYSHAQYWSAVIMVSTPVMYVNTWITTYVLTPEGWKAKLA